MKISENWLRQWVNPNLNAEQIGEQLTMAGLELDELSQVAKPFGGVVVGEVLSCEPHPDADKLKVTTVNVGQGEPLQIVCGAPNVDVGIKAPVALVGAQLPSADGTDKPFNIKKGKLRGVESQGMLCGASEIDLEDEVDGLLILPSDAPVGMNVREYLHLDNHVLDISITPNRGDCFSVRGIAREVAVLNDLPFNTPFDDKAVITPTSHEAQAIHVQTTACPRYFAQVVDGLSGTMPSPDWLKQHLLAVGVKPKNLLVDVTNYVLFELGQPLHAFDKDKLVGAITVRIAKTGETLVLLNEQEITLMGDELVICDDAGVIALAGVMGGLRTAVSDETTSVVIESAFFDQLAIAGRARRFGLHTDASQRFERGVDFALPPVALGRAVGLLSEYGGDDVMVGQVSVAGDETALPMRHSTAVPLAKIRELLGIELPKSSIINILSKLAIDVVDQGDTLVCTPPTHRFDLNIIEDYIEEVVRIYGYDNIAPVLPTFAVDMSYDDTADLTHAIKQSLTAVGYDEAVSFSFSDAGLESLLDDDKLGAVLPLANPISSELAVMRRTLLSSLLPVVQYNLNRQQDEVRLFEMGLSFVGDNVANLVQTPSLALVACAKRLSGSHHVNAAMDFYDFKQHIETVLPTKVRHQAVYKPADLAFLHPYQSAVLGVGETVLGWFGQLHPSIAKALDVPTVWVAQLDLNQILDLYRPVPKIVAPSKFPSVGRDLAFLVAMDKSWQDLLDDIKLAAGDNLTDVQLFDVYQGERLPAGKQSLAFRLTWQKIDGTLDDDTIKGLMDKVVQVLASKHGAELRDG